MLQDHEINRLMIDNLQSVIYLCQYDAFFTPLQLNGQIEAMSGYKLDDFMSGQIKIPDLYHPDEQEMIFREVKKAAKEDRAYHLVHRMRIRDGGWMWVESIGKLLVDEKNPEQWYITGFLLDITERKKLQDQYRKLSAIVHNSPASVVVTDIDGTIEYVNPKFEKITGYSSDEAIGKNPSVLKSGLQTQAYYQELWETILAGHEWRGEFSNKKKNGEFYWELASISPIVNDVGKIESFVAVKEDITERKKAEQALEEAKAALEKQVLALERRNREIALFSQMQSALQDCETKTETYHVLAEYAEQLFPDVSGSLFEVSPDEELVRLAGWGGICSVTPDFPFPDQFEEVSQSGESITKAFLSDCYIGEDDAVTAHQSLCIPLFTQGALWGVFQLVLQPGQKVKQSQQLAVSVAQQYLLTVENLRLQEELRGQAVRDPLTGLYNRRYLEESLEREISRAKRKELTLGVIMLDIDHFKQFNDQYGHDVGDIVLRQIGLFLHDSVRGGDVACRYGGEEFLVILPEICLEDAVERAESLRIGVEKLNMKEYRSYPGKLSVSLGVALFPQHGDTGHAVMLAADHAMYQAKHAGRNRVQAFEG
jgi:diguanylate cyclase (GGDEF)-like protein/PAS domain S-box-containing protein